MERSSLVATIAIAMACADTDAPDSSDVVEPSPAKTQTTGDTGVTVPSLQSFDCATVPDTIGAVTTVGAARGYNDVVFDTDGGLIGWDGNLLLRATDPVTAAPFATVSEMVYKLARLPDGDLVAALATGDVIRIDSVGVRTPIAHGLFAYGLAVGPDGLVYASGNYDASEAAIWRIDPDTGDVAIWQTLAYLSWPRDIAFSGDFSALYIGTRWNGSVLKVAVDADVEPAGLPEALATVPTQWHDTVEVDACGNVYVGGLYPPQLHRIEPDGSTPILTVWSYVDYGHGFDWGSAPWDDHSVYVAYPDSFRVEAWVLGVPGRGWTGEVVGGTTL